MALSESTYAHARDHARARARFPIHILSSCLPRRSLRGGGSETVYPPWREGSLTISSYSNAYSCDEMTKHE